MFRRSVSFRIRRMYSRAYPQGSTRLMKSSINFSKKTLFSQRVSSASISRVWRFIAAREARLPSRSPVADRVSAQSSSVYQHPASRRCLALPVGEPFQNALGDLLDLAESRQVVLEV